MLISLIATSLKRLGMVCLAFVIIWHVARHIDPRRGEVIVHAPKPGVLVSIDHLSFPVGSPSESPVVCSLDPGDHVVKVMRDGVILGEERFTVEPGGEVVLGPFDGHGSPSKVGLGDGGSSRVAESTHATGLVHHVQKTVLVH